MKKLSFIFMCVAALSFFLVGCSPEDPKPPVEIVEDGLYLSGEATSSAELKTENLMSPGINETGQVLRNGMYEKYVALEANKDFTITKVTGSTKVVYGATLTLTDSLHLTNGDWPKEKVYKGTYSANGGAMQVNESGLYHIMMEDSLKTIVIAPAKWGVRGVMNGWGFTQFSTPTFDKNTMTYTVENVDVTSDGKFKFSYASGWKIDLSTDGTIQANTNLGNNSEEEVAIMENDLKQGGKDITIARGVYTIELTWTLKDGDLGKSFSAKVTKTGETSAPEYPENIYMIGADLGGWDWAGSYIVTMNPVHSHPHAFWAIVYLTPPASDPGIKFSPVKEWNGNFGVTGTATDGVYDRGSSNVTVTEAGYYMVYVDLKAKKISVTAPEVYLIGPTIGDVWNYKASAGLFTVNNSTKKITSPAFSAGGELRMYATCPLSQLDDPVADWWQMEFILLDGQIAYRGKGDDQTRVTVNAGDAIALDFQAGTGSIE
ncbi:MAG: SusF/SusE family outer membrane protein [Paludibacteraceae bacterium]